MKHSLLPPILSSEDTAATLAVELPDPTLAGNGRESIAVDQPPAGSYFPFQPYPADNLELLVADFYLEYDDESCNFSRPFHVTALWGFGEINNSPPASYTPVHDYEILVEDDNGLTVFDSRNATSLYTDDWDGRLTTVEWRSSTAVGRLVFHTAWGPDDEVINFKKWIETDAKLDDRALLRLPSRVRSIRVGATTISGDSLSLEEGYNFSMSIQEQDLVDGGRFVTPILMRAESGDGVGRFPGCEEVSTAIRTINNIGGDNTGNFRIETEGRRDSELSCLRIYQPSAITSTSPRQASVTGATLELANDCAPCCDCEDFVSVYKALSSIWNNYKEMGQDAEEARDQHAANIDRWNEQKECREAKAGRLVTVGGNGCQITVASMMCNVCDDCQVDIRLRFTFETFRGGSPTSLPISLQDLTIEGSSTDGEIPGSASSVSSNVFDVFIDYANPGSPSIARFRANFTGCQAGDAVRIHFSGHGIGPEGCPTVQVPEDVIALWPAPLSDPARFYTFADLGLNP